MYLRDIIERLGREDPNRVLPIGWGAPDSYRGYYEDLAFEPATNVTIGSMLDNAKYALGRTFTGYKGGEYRMTEWTDCWIAEYGESSDNSISPMLLDFILAQK